MVEESFDNFDEPAAPVVLETAVAQVAELPDIKLFGKWSCDDVQVSDMSLQVTFSSNHFFVNDFFNFFFLFSGLYCC